MLHIFICVVLLLLPLIVLINGLSIVLLFSLLVLSLCWSARDNLCLTGYRLWNHQVSWAILLMLWPLLSVLWSVTPAYTLKTVVRLILVLVVLFAFMPMLKKRKLSYFEGQRFVYGMLLAIGVMLTELLPSGGIVSVILSLLGRDTVLFFHKDLNRGLCAISVLIWPMVLFMNKTNHYKIALWVPFVWLLVLFMMQSGSALVGFSIATIIFYTALRFPNAIRVLIPYGTLLILAYWPPLFHALEGWIRESWYMYLPESSQHRIEIWSFAIDKWQEAPWLGWGANASRAIPGALDEIRVGWVNLPMHPHNMPIQILLELGLVGYMIATFALFQMLLSIFRSIRIRQKHIWQNACMASGVTAYLLIGFFAFNMWQSWWLITGVFTFLLYRLRVSD